MPKDRYSYWKKYTDSHPQYKEKRKLYAKKCRLKVRIDVINMLGGKCVKCGFTDLRALQLDHINGWGARERRNANDNIRVYRKYRNNPEEAKKILQVLCANCNIIKRDERRECYNRFTITTNDSIHNLQYTTSTNNTTISNGN